MFSAIFEFWYNLPVLLRVGLSLVLIGVSVLTWFAGYVWVWPGAVGLILLLFSGSGSNKGGYHF